MTDLIANDIAADPYTRSLADSTRLLEGAPWKRFAVLGDSHAAGVRETVDGYPDKSWYDWVSEALGAVQPSFASQNFGVKGYLTKEVKAKQLAPALAFAPDLAVILCGGNDVLRGSLKGVGEEFDEMIAPLQAQGCLVITMGLFDITKSPRVPEMYREAILEQLTPLYSMIEAVASRHQTEHLNFGVHPAAAEDNVYASDNMHLTTRGHAVVAATVIDALSKRIA